MSMFNTYWQSNYDELVTFYPRFYKEIFEMDEILKAEGKLLDGAQSGIDEMLSNNFVETADAAAVSELENFLEISGNSGKSLEERKAYIMSFLFGFGKISESLLKKIIFTCTGLNISCIFEPFDEEKNNCLYIIFDENADISQHIESIKEILKRRLPAHIITCLRIRIRKEAGLYAGALPQVIRIRGLKPAQYKELLYWDDIENKPEAFPPEEHTHQDADESTAGFASGEFLQKLYSFDRNNTMSTAEIDNLF